MSADHKEREELKAFHEPHRVRDRIREETRPDLLKDTILGAVDGTITTFAIVAGSVGGGFSTAVIIVLGFANLLADGLSMAVSNYLSTKSEREQVILARRNEERHIDVVPAHQQDEVRQIFAEKGFSGETLEQIVSTITSDRRLWVDTVLTEEFGRQLVGTDPWRAGLATFFAFLVAGVFPLFPFLVPGIAFETAFAISIVVTGATFMAVGMVKGRIVGIGIWRAGLETLLTGGAAALLAYMVGHGLRQWVGVD
jgi:vacuolar iron transporter family protein